MKKIHTWFDAIKGMCNVRAILAVMLGGTFAIMAIHGTVSPTEFQTVFMAIILYFFSDSGSTPKGGVK